MGEVFCNGTFVERDAATISAFDAGVQHAVGLFETMLGVNDDNGPRIVGLREHMERLATSARELRLSEDLNAEALGEAALETVKRSGHDRSRVRLTVTGGDLNLLQSSGSSNARATVLIDAQPATAYPEAMFERGVMVTIAEARANPLEPTASHKTLNYWWRLRELQIAAGKGGGEALVFDVTNHLAGGCVSNAIAIKGDVAMTPIVRGEERAGGVPSPVLPGVTRGMALGWLEDAGLEVQRRMLTIDDVLDADELVLTNSGFGVLPVIRVEANDIGAGAPGPVTRGLIERWGGASG
ncbi:MAG: aminotransferase class IV [Planctomycetota bacterium]